jgi:hypothetical protein
MLSREVTANQMSNTQGASSKSLRRRHRQRAAVAPVADDEFISASMAFDCIAATRLADGSTETSKAEQVAVELLRDMSIDSFRQAAFADKMSCRAAQMALERASTKEAVILAVALHSHVRKCVQSMFANYVLQKLVECVPVSHSSFVSQELCGVGVEIARHRFGCRILCRILEFGSFDDPHTRALFDEILIHAETLIRHSFGSYVMQHVLEFGPPEHQLRVVEALRKDLFETSACKRASRLVEAALRLCGADEQEAITTELIDNCNLLSLSMDQSGCHVVKALFSMPMSLAESSCILAAFRGALAGIQVWKARFG